MFSETRYALNGDLRVAFRTSHEGERDIVFVAPPFTNCEVFPELPYIQGWLEAMTSLGRLIYFDQPGTGVSDPATPTLELRADSITAVLDDPEAAKLSSSRSTAHSRNRRCLQPHIHPAQPRWSCSRATRIRFLNAPRDPHPRGSLLSRQPRGARGRLRTSRIRTCRGTKKFGHPGRGMNAWRQAQGSLLT